jgi:hypothetical protein
MTRGHLEALEALEALGALTTQLARELTTQRLRIGADRRICNARRAGRRGRSARPDGGGRDGQDRQGGAKDERCPASARCGMRKRRQNLCQLAHGRTLSRIDADFSTLTLSPDVNKAHFLRCKATVSDAVTRRTRRGR